MRHTREIGTALAVCLTLTGTGATAQNVTFANQAAADSYTRVAQMLDANGYAVTSVERTLLGRYLIVASNGVHVREIVLSRTTGEIKHDAVVGSSSAGNNGNKGGKDKGKANGRGSGGGGASGGKSGGNGNGNSGGGGNGNGKGKK